MADIVLKDRNGSPVEYPGVERIKVNTVDGEAVEFVDSAVIPEVVENLPIALDFSGGNQEIIAPDGVVVKSAIIQQPANLIPENIAAGVDIAGIIGTLAGGGNLVFASGSVSGFSSGDSEITVQHNLGVAPDIVFLYTTTRCNSSVNFQLQQHCGLSTALAEATGTKFVYMFSIMKATSTALSAFTYSVYSGDAITGAIDSIPPVAFIAMVNSANAQSFNIKNGGGGVYLNPSATYTWFAIGGLT